MPWDSAKFLETDERVIPSFFPNNLAGDGEGRFAFAHGGRVQCTRRHCKRQGRNDFTLAMKTDGIEVMEVFWWQNVPRYPRPLLVLVTDAPPGPDGKPSLQIWDTRSGRGNRVFSIKIDDQHNTDIRFARGIGSARVGDDDPFLFVGLSTGDVLGYQIKRGHLLKVCTLKGLTSATSSLAADKVPSPYVCAADESGNIVVWMYRNATWRHIYRYHDGQDDYVCSLGLRGRIMVAGHSSGKVSFHDLDGDQKLAETVTNARGITCIDMHPTQGLLLVAGEDCRATILALPTEDGESLKVVLSVCLNGSISGGGFTCTRPDMPDITLLMWERTHLVQYEFTDHVVV